VTRMSTSRRGSRMTGTLLTITPEAQELITFASTFMATVEAIQIVTEDDAQGAVDQTRRIKECAKALDETRKGYTVPLDEAKKAYMDLFRPAVDSLEKAEKVLKAEIGRYTAEQARVAAEAEKARRAQEAEDRKRQEAEQAAAAQLLQQADDAAAAGDYATAEALEEQAAAAQLQAAPALIPATLAPEKPKGASVRQVWKARVIDPAKIPAMFLQPNLVALDSYAKATKGAQPVPGVEFYAEGSVTIR